MLGLVAVKEATPPPQPLQEGEAPPQVPASRYATAIDLFNKVTQLPPDTPEHKLVIDLSWLAIGRLFYEADQWTQAVQAYNQSIERRRNSARCSTSWPGYTFARDVDRASAR